MPFILAVFLASYAVYIAANLVVAFVFRLFKIGVEEVQLFYGKPLASFHAGGIEWKLGWIPLGLSVKFVEARFLALPRLGQAACYLAMPLPLIALGVALLGWEGSGHHLWTGFRQYLEGGIHPQKVAWVLVDKLRQLHEASTPRFIGVVAMKLATLQLLPFGVTAITQALWALLKRPDSETDPGWLHGIMIFGTMLNILCSLIWLVVFVAYDFKTRF